MKLKEIHTIEDLITKFGELPLCACGCGEKVTVTLTLRSIKLYSEKGYPTYKNGHAFKGKTHSENSLQKNRDAHLGNKDTEETKRNKSKAHIGNKNHFFGKKHSDNNLLKMKGRRKLSVNEYELTIHPTIEKLENLLGTIPLCQCGCGNNVTISLKISSIYSYITKGYPKYINGHHIKGCKNPMKNPEITALFKNPRSENIKKKISDSQLGEKGYWYNKEFSEIHKSKISNAQTGDKNHNYGRLPPNDITYGNGSYYNSPFQGKVWFRSSYELAYAKYLDKLNEPWFYELETFIVTNTTYTPDFFLPRKELFVEIKGYMHEKSKIKIEKFQEEYPFDLQVLYRNDLIGLGIKL